MNIIDYNSFNFEYLNEIIYANKDLLNDKFYFILLNKLINRQSLTNPGTEFANLLYLYKTSITPKKPPTPKAVTKDVKKDAAN